MSVDSKIGRGGYLNSLAESSVGITAFNKTDSRLADLGIPTLARRLAATTAAGVAFIAPAFARSFESHDEQVKKIYRYPAGLLVDVTSVYGAPLVTKILFLAGAGAGVLTADNFDTIGSYAVASSMVAGKFASNMLANHLLNRWESRSLARSRINSV